jgi:ParB family transcriptional regulator, chromosome partitioning protein
MKAAERLTQQLQAHIDESMGAASAAAVHGGPFPPATLVRGGPEKYLGAPRSKDVLVIELGRIAPDPGQPRKEFDPGALADLAASLKARGQLQPIRVRWDEGSARWIIIAGERRYRAALLAGLPTLMCVEAKGPLTPGDILEDQLVENALREDLRPIEQARAFKALLEQRGCSQRQLAESLHVPHQTVVRALALLALPGDIQEQVDGGAVPASAAYELARVADDATRRELADQVVAGELTRDEVTARVRAVSSRSAGGKGMGAKAKPRKVTSRTLKTSAGKVTVENRRGLDGGALATALREALDQVEAEQRGRGEAA